MKTVLEKFYSVFWCMKYWILLVFSLLSIDVLGQIYSTINGRIEFVSDAPLEIIKASSDEMQGVLDFENKTFAFKMYIKSFEGFNNPLQQVHFYENYMEATEFPIAYFKGKILEPIELHRKIYRAKGGLEIHGQTIERIIQVELDISENQVEYVSGFYIPLKNHNIELPRIVYQKIAEEIQVSVSGKMKLKK